MEKLTFDQLLEKLQNLKILQKSIDWEEDLSEELLEYFEPSNIVADELDINRHRWYETCVRVYQIGDRFLGINYLSNSYSEHQMVEDCYHHLEFFEMKRKEIISYKYIQLK